MSRNRKPWELRGWWEFNPARPGREVHGDIAGLAVALVAAMLVLLVSGWAAWAVWCSVALTVAALGWARFRNRVPR